MVVEAKTRRCVVRASSSPPPNAGAASADIVGIGSCDIEVRVPRKDVRKFSVLHSELNQYSVRCAGLDQGLLFGCEARPFL